MNPKDQEIDVLIRARYPMMYIVSPEEARVEDAVRRIVNGKKQVLSWAATQPFGATDPHGRVLGGAAPVTLDGHQCALDALDHIARRLHDDVRAVFILRD